MKIKMLMAAALLAVSSASVVAQTTKDGATAGEKPGQGTNTGGPTKEGKMMGPPPVTDSGTAGTSSGSTGNDMPASKQPGANGQGVTPNANSGPDPK